MGAHWSFPPLLDANTGAAVEVSPECKDLLKRLLVVGKAMKGASSAVSLVHISSAATLFHSFCHNVRRLNRPSGLRSTKSSGTHGSHPAFLLRR